MPTVPEGEEGVGCGYGGEVFGFEKFIEISLLVFAFEGSGFCSTVDFGDPIRLRISIP